jgi:hypothetical protein
MKALYSMMLLILISSSVMAQSDKYVKAMEEKIAAIEKTNTSAGWQELANGFERIAEAEKNQWLPYYYAAMSNVMTGYMLSNGQPGGANITQLDQMADKAEVMLNKAEELEKDNSDIYCIRKMINTLKLTADPMTRYQTYGPKGEEALAKAKVLDPANPRIYLLEGQDKFFTPEQFGGSKTEAKVLFETSLKKFEEFKPKSSIHPSWGKSQVEYSLSQIK